MDAPSITTRWKRIIAFGCSHGKAIRPDARAAVLCMIERWKPDTIIHLGDWADLTAFRAGAKGSADESAPILPDIDAGLDFLTDARCNVVMMGNHEERIHRLAGHPNSMIAECARSTMRMITDKLTINGARWGNAGPTG
jgi:hypothetical protein